MTRKVYEKFVDYSNNNSDISNIENPDISSDWDSKHSNFSKQLYNYDTVNSNLGFNDSIPNNRKETSRYVTNNNHNNNSIRNDDNDSQFLLNDNSNQMNYLANGNTTNVSYSSFFSDPRLQSPIRNSQFYTDNNSYTQSEQEENKAVEEEEEEDSGSNSSVTIHSSTRLSHDPFDTVQQRHKSSNRTTMDDPEFLSYLRKGQRRDNVKHGNANLSRNSLNDLIVRGIGELSGEVYNTFKNKTTKSNNNNGSNNNVNGTNSIEEERKDEELEEQDSEDLETSNEVLRDANNVFDDMISQNKNKMTLITPLVAGLNFENNLGKWVRDTDRMSSQDISANHTVADISSSTTTNANTTTHPSNRTSSKINLFNNVARNKDNRRSRNSNNSNDRKVKNSKRNGQNSMLEDTPLPFRIKTNFQDLESSIETLEGHKMQLIRKLTPLLVDKDWETVSELNAAGQNLEDVTSLATCLPALIKCDLSNNNIKIFNSGASIPTNLIELNLSKNLINDTYLYSNNDKDDNNNNNNNGGDGGGDGSGSSQRQLWDKKPLLSFNNVKILDLSNNRFKMDLSWLRHHGFINVQELNISGNKIRSLNGLPSRSMIRRIDLSGNCIRGVVDFEDLVNEDGGQYGWQSVEHMDLSNNQITRVYNLDRLRSLRSINLNGNPLESVIFYYDPDSEYESSRSRSRSRSCSSSSRIEVLKIRSDRLKVVGKSINRQFLPLPRLQELEIGCYDGFSQMNFLPNTMVKLSVFGGRIDGLIPWGKIPGSLRTLELVGIDGLDELPRDPGMEIRLTSVQELNLSNNELSSWENLIQFIPYSHLKTLRLEGNGGLLCENGRMNREELEPELRRLLKRAVPCLESIII